MGARDKKILEDLERDVGRVRKAREIEGDKAPKHGPSARGGRESGVARGGRGGHVLGKRERDRDRDVPSDISSETDEDVRAIPMPRDTPPPIPPRRYRRGQGRDQNVWSAEGIPYGGGKPGGNPNLEALGDGRGGGERVPQSLLSEQQPKVAPVQMVYEAEAVVRDLRQEAVNRFVPTVVKKKFDAKTGRGPRLLQEDEVEKLEREGYGNQTERNSSAQERPMVMVDAAPKFGKADQQALEAEEERFARDIRVVQVEDS